MRRMAVAPVDERARKILFDAYWTSKGWLDERSRNTAAADLAYAKSKGLMFAPLTITHDRLVARVRDAARALTIAQVRDAFLASLSTRRPDLRSGLASYVLASAGKPHAFKPDINGVWCRGCGSVRSYQNEDLSVLNFERHKWGGVRHTDPLYQSLNLTALRASLPATPEPEDHAILRNILRAIERTPKQDGPGKLAKRLKDVVPSSPQERNVLLDILGAAGVLVPRGERSSPGEWSFVGMWRGADGYDTKTVARIFGKARTRGASR